jgi:uncharacterized protein (DUF488 family)
MDKPTIYTIGHSTHPISKFLELLRPYQVNCIVDVRSVAASRFNPQYNKKSLAELLRGEGIDYLHFADEFGARQTNPVLLDIDGQVDFEKFRASEKFKDGIKRLGTGVNSGYTIALMCSEADPLHCHRFAMISPALKDFEVKHILKDATIQSQHQMEQKLLEIYGKKAPQLNIFQNGLSEEERLLRAFRLLNKEVGYFPGSVKRKSKS